MHANSGNSFSYGIFIRKVIGKNCNSMQSFPYTFGILGPSGVHVPAEPTKWQCLMVLHPFLSFSLSGLYTFLTEGGLCKLNYDLAWGMLGFEAGFHLGTEEKRL